MDTIGSFGWAIETTRCDHFDTNCVFALNLVLPRAGIDKGANDWVTGAPVVSYAGKNASDILDELLLPWRWTNICWQLYGWRTGGTATDWTPLGPCEALEPGVPLPLQSHVEELRHRLQLEVIARTNDCASAFAVTAEVLGERQDPDDVLSPIIGQSWAHAVVGLTHLPAVLSNATLNLAGFRIVTDAEASVYQQFVAFPTFDVGGIRYAPSTVEAVLDNGNPDRVRARYGLIAATDIELVFGAQPASKDPNDLQGKTSVELASGKSGTSAATRSMAANCMPAATLAAATLRVSKDQDIMPDEVILALKPFPRDEWLVKLAESLGRGWLIARLKRDGRRVRPHLLEFVETKAEFADLAIAFPSAGGFDLETAFGAPFDPARLQSVLGECVTLAEPKSPLLAAFQTLADGKLIPEIDDGKPDFAARRRAAILQFLEAWCFLADLEAQEAVSGVLEACWLQALIRTSRPGAAEPIPTVLRRIAERIGRRVDSMVVPRLMRGVLDELDGHSGNLWDLLRKYALHGPSPNPHRADIEAWLKPRAASGISTVPALLPEAVVEMVSEFEADFAAEINSDSSLAKDEGLRLRFEDDDAPLMRSPIDTLIRGYCIGLCGGVRLSDDAKVAPTWDNKRAAWVTDVAVTYDDKGQLLQVDPQRPRLAWLAETLGSSTNDNERVVSTPYMGSPLCAVRIGEQGQLVDVDLNWDESRALDYRWPVTQRELPWLGYGMHYRGISTALDNAGGVVQKIARGAGAAELCVLDESLPWPGEIIPYVSRVPLGAPRLSRDLPGLCYELTNETKAVRVLTQSRKPDDAPVPLPRVACLAHDQPINNVELFATRHPKSATLDLLPPLPTAGFQTSWLLTDRLIRELADDAMSSRLCSDPHFANVPKENFFEFLKGLDVEDKEGRHRAYNPAFFGYAVEVAFNDGAPAKPVIVGIAATQVSQQKQLQLAADRWGHSLRITTKVGAVRSELNSSATELTLRPGDCARIRVYSLVEEKFFTGESCQHRFLDQLEAATTFTESGKTYRAFGPVERWVEALPTWNSTDYRTPLDIELLAPASYRDSARLRGTFKAPATWLAGIDITRHVWHWTGYPVRFPSLDRRTDLAAWLPAFAGVESARKDFDLLLPTRVAGDAWHICADGQSPPDPITLDEAAELNATPRPARYVSYTVRPRVRFRSWLNPRLVQRDGPMSLTEKPFAAGNFIEGVGPAARLNRLAPPKVIATVPLTAGYEYAAQRGTNSSDLRRIESGNLVIFDEQLRRTDSLTHIGGIGDTIEIDLLEARVTFGGKEYTNKEIGVNPIFHAAITKLSTQPTLIASDPFGLTFDSQVRNAKVAQTAVVVSPQNSEGHWMLAKFRTRRVILPETQLDASSVGNQGVYSLSWRMDGTDRIPADFAIDLDGQSWPSSVAIQCSGQASYKIELPAPREGTGPRRLLCSMHKERWGTGGEATWRVQVLLQIPTQPECMDWTTIAMAPGKQPDWSARDGQLNVKIDGASPRAVYEPLLSDYTEPRWLTIIGTFRGSLPGMRADEYRLQPVVNAGQVIGLQFADQGIAGLTRPPAKLGWRSGKTEFHLLLVYQPTNTVMRGAPDKNAGALRAVFQPNLMQDGFEPLAKDGPVKPSDLGGAFAYLCSFQRINSPSSEENEIEIDSWQALVEAMFPDPGVNGEIDDHESVVRPLPKHLGPLRIL